MAKSFDLGDASSLARTGLIVAGGGALIYLAYKSNLLGLGQKVLEGTAGAANYALESVGGAANAVVDYWNNGTGKLLLAAGGNGGNIEATSAAVVIRLRDFNSQWQISSTAYQAAKGMHSDNERILKTYVLDGLGLKPSLQKLIKLTDFVVIRSNGEIQSA